MKMIKNKNELIKIIKKLKLKVEKSEAYVSQDNENATFKIEKPPILFIVEKDVMGPYNFIVEYNAKEKIIYGVPVKLLTAIEDLKGIPGVFYMDGVLATHLTEYIVIDKVDNIDFTNWPIPLEGISHFILDDENLINISGDEITIPNHILSIFENALDNCRCKILNIPTQLLPQIARSGIILEDDYVVKIQITGDFGLNWPTIKSYKGRCTKYVDILEKGENIIVYPKKLTIEVRNEEREYLPGYNWSHFFESKEDMIMGLLLARYNIVTISGMVQGMLDIYYKVR